MLVVMGAGTVAAWLGDVGRVELVAAAAGVALGMWKCWCGRVYSAAKAGRAGTGVAEAGWTMGMGTEALHMVRPARLLR